MASLYEIDRDIQAFIDGVFAMADENGEVDIDMDILEDLKEQRQTKLENIALYIKNLASEASAIKEEEESSAITAGTLMQIADKEKVESLTHSPFLELELKGGDQ